MLKLRDGRAIKKSLCCAKVGRAHLNTVQATIYNGRAVCYMKVGDYEEAERDLLEAFNKDAKNAETLSNLITCGLHLGKNVQRYIT
jgi:tetratricopeptide (TPR) repeat protein